MTLSYELVNNSCPILGDSFAACSYDDESILTHGGLEPGYSKGRSSHGSTVPRSILRQYNLNQDRWDVLESTAENDNTVSGPPALCNHCIVANDRLIYLVGGYDGRSRTQGIWIFDPRDKSWHAGDINGFPRGGGLSSHTVSPLKGNSWGAVVTGRLGGTRTQRRTATVMELRQENVQTFEYRPCGTAAIKSRSGHTATTLDKHRILVIGGREGVAGQIDWEVISTEPSVLQKAPKIDIVLQDPAVPQSPAHYRSRSVPTDNRRNRRNPNIPQARREHVALKLGDNRVLIHGGVAFNALRAHPFGDTFTLNPYSLIWERVNTTGCPSLYGHKAVVVAEKAYFIGGMGDKQASRSVYQLKDGNEQ